MTDSSIRRVAPTIVAGARAGVPAPTWKEAVHAAGGLLVDSGCCSPAYVTAMVDAVRDLGPYIVVAPGVAMPHARPEAGVTAPGVSLVTLAAPVEFGHAANDPVDLVIAFSALDKTAHLVVLQQIVHIIQDGEALTALRAATSDAEALAIFERHQKSPSHNNSRSQA